MFFGSVTWKGTVYRHHQPHLFLCRVFYHMHQKTTTSSQIQEVTQYRQLKNCRRGPSLTTQTNRPVLNLALPGLRVCQACETLLMFYSQTNKVPLSMCTTLDLYKQIPLAYD